MSELHVAPHIRDLNVSTAYATHSALRGPARTTRRSQSVARDPPLVHCQRHEADEVGPLIELTPGRRMTCPVDPFAVRGLARRMSVLEVRDVEVVYLRRDPIPVRAVAGTTLSVDAGEIVGLVGETGCGK